MKSISIVCLLLLCQVLVVCCSTVTTTTLSGVLSLDRNAVLAGEPPSTILVQLFQYGLNDSPPSISQVHTVSPFASVQVNNVTSASRSYVFYFNNVPVENYQYSVLAYVLQPAAQKAKSSFMKAQANKLINVAGWYKSDPCGWLGSFRADASFAKQLVIDLTGVRPFRTSNSNIKSKNGAVNGRLQIKKGIPVLELWGTPEERGYAHGYLIAEQILDFFAYFILEGTAASCHVYENKWIPMFEQSVAGGSDTAYYFEPELLTEARSVISGMRDSGVNLYVPLLNRELNVLDILAINSYIELEFLKRDIEDSTAKDQEPQVACTQFAFWNTQTMNVPGVYGNTVAGRNMDGELDFRRSTVTNFMVFAVSPKNGKKYASMMWPGFLGTLSGVNEDGQYLMMNYGVSSNEKPEWDQVVPVNWIVRQLLAYPSVPIEKANAQSTLAHIQQFNAKTGGPCITGCVLFFAKPYVNGSSDSPAYVYEGDYKSGLMRLPTQADPTYINDAILASNHYHKYGVDPKVGPHYNFGRLMYFDTLVRYQAGSYKVKSYDDVLYLKGNVNEVLVEQVLQSVAHGTTEHSIVVKNSGKDKWIYIAVARHQDMNVGWDAPYLEWQPFQFEDFFSQP